MNIGQAAKATGVTAKMIRHYETIGLIAQSHRTEAGYRQYSSTDLHNLRFIKSARSLGFSLNDIEQLLSLWQAKDRASADVKVLAQHHLDALSAKILELTQMRDTIQKLVAHCQGDQRPDCPIINGLAHSC
ncbi:Cu(I)-responsive transcriptional regulator [Cellvibrio sp. QJXJ]|uniref:Cu(I)-responsive transcriptional regulator n=1 Tax=Cellvibrio sp. QJXJ TaxID=2964606 RepID=UPI0021C3C1D6|nr:Cu(I)-responsive transcriptional regulator [Cellvibrio sp. QJXJ]UUA74953.1 Cu(I)-responsive transcriptional regulator [Cellvibrio sp. QJXJ]